MRGLLERGNHRFAAVESEGQAWDFVRENLQIDLVIIELQLQGSLGVDLLQRLRGDSQLPEMPVLIYTARADRNTVKRCLELKVQNFLIKPYEEEQLFQEIGKALTHPWRASLFEEESSFCRMMGYRSDELREEIRGVGKGVDAILPELRIWAEDERVSGIPDRVHELREAAERAGTWGVVAALNGLEECVKAGRRPRLGAAIDSLALSGRFIDLRLAADTPCLGFMSERESGEREAEALRAVWLNAPAQGRCPILRWSQIEQRIDALPGFPVIDSVAAAFQMTATGQPSCMNPLMDLVARDSALSVQLLVAANKAHPAGAGESCIEDARSAVGQLGEMKVAALARNLVVVKQSTLEVPPSFNWPKFWMFNRGVARIAQLICHQLELYSMEPIARTAGELHDIGKLLLAHLEPIGFQIIIEHARTHRLPLREVEPLFVDSTTAQMGAHFADKFGLSRRLAHVIRWIDDPAAATEDARLVAVVSLARAFCEHNGVGASGEYRDPGQPFLADRTKAWAVLEDCVFPSFNLREFERLINARCRVLRMDLAGRERRADAGLLTLAS